MSKLHISLLHLDVVGTLVWRWREIGRLEN